MAPASQETVSINELISGSVFPGRLLFIGILYFARTFVISPLLAVTDFQTFRHKAFAKLWETYGVAMSREMPGNTIELIASAKGVVLDVGPGTGALVHYFKPENITKIYGIEPAVDMHPQLRESARKAGLGDKYEILAAGAEPKSLVPALAKRKLIKTGDGNEDGIFDTILCLRVLCGVPNHRETIEVLYRCLKSGGRMIICEHVVNSWPNGGHIIGKLFQRIYVLLGWQFWLAGCDLERDTENVLKGVAGKDGWEKFDVVSVGSYGALPFIVGEVVKK